MEDPEDKSHVTVVITWQPHLRWSVTEDIHSECGLLIALTCDAQMFIFIN